MSNYTENIIKILASLPDFLRRPMIRNRVNEFFSMDEEEKYTMIRNVLDAIPDIDRETLSRIVKTWSEVVSMLDEAKRNEIFNIYASILDENPSLLSRIDVEGLNRVFLELDEAIRDRIGYSIKHAIIGKQNILSNLRDEIRSILQI